MQRIAIVLALMIGAGCAAAAQAGDDAEPSPLPLGALGLTTYPPDPHVDSTLAAAPTDPSMDFASLAQQCAAAVVQIDVTEDGQAGDYPFETQDPDGDPGSALASRRSQPPSPSLPSPARGIGSGFIVTADGVILTNAHVVDGARRVDVRLADQRSFQARVIGIDEPSDVAVLEIDAHNLPAVKLGKPEQLRVGDWVVAIGSPFGFGSTVTQGIVSAKTRALPGEPYVPFIQTDVPVNPGNSGGPLFDVKGEVVGINSQILSGDGGYQGISFAIPIDIAANVGTQLLRHGRVTRARLGVTIQEMTQDLADAFGMQRPDGALVTSVEVGSAAGKAGLEPGDVILKFNDEQIINPVQLPARIGSLQPGTKVRFTVFHRDSLRSVEVTLGELHAVPVRRAGRRVAQ